MMAVNNSRFGESRPLGEPSGAPVAGAAMASLQLCPSESDSESPAGGSSPMGLSLSPGQAGSPPLQALTPTSSSRLRVLTAMTEVRQRVFPKAAGYLSFYFILSNSAYRFFFNSLIVSTYLNSIHCVFTNFAERAA